MDSKLPQTPLLAHRTENKGGMNEDKREFIYSPAPKPEGVYSGLLDSEDIDPNFYLKEWLRRGGMAADAHIGRNTEDGGRGGQWKAHIAGFVYDPYACFYACVCPALMYADTLNLAYPSENWWDAACMHMATDALSILWIACLWPVFLPLPFSVPIRVRLRVQLRRQLRIPGNLITDTLLHVCCYPCALVQEHAQAVELARVDILDNPPPPPPEPEEME
eukprot:CAMPEP_0184483736 /NCGR_PEP_ID=MMETSP0113_2-20130426/5414_1 /TAXON_ID=91329 /ORGANISM="Norrisiella sphaerica, Strain BC52" /LENGTH=218 /DNA_ID=CAMNT_0026864319 /DNA_START=242 /DNA_END=898 /DNA_ORIENTATION=-